MRSASVFTGITSCLCFWASLYMPVIYWALTVELPKIVTSRAIQSHQYSTFSAFLPTPLRDNFLHFCSLRMSLEIVSKYFKASLADAALFQCQDMRGSSIKKKRKKKKLLCWDTLNTGFLSVVSEVWSDSLLALWSHALKFRRQGGIPLTQTTMFEPEVLIRLQ